MNILSALYTLVISPLELLFEVIFTIANRIIGNEGLSIIFLSLAVNFLVLPLYKRADELQAEERDIQAKMAYRIKRTKETFKGDERFMMLQEYYRINNYKPIYALRSSFSLLLQIPFFIAAYNLLSGMQSLQGMPFGFISDLGKEDAMFMIGSFPVNILPILMTLINVVSGIIYTKGHPLKEKIQVYGLAAVFLVLLYRSPSGLVFYWLLNNVFSLVKNVFYKLKDPKKALGIVLAIAGVIIPVIALTREDYTPKRKLFLALFGLLLVIPLAVNLIKNKIKKRPAGPVTEDRGTFAAGVILMAVITGILIPAAVINDSTVEFINPVNPHNPADYIINSALLAFGSWVLWVSVFYYFMSVRAKALFSKVICAICGTAVINYLLFGTRLGVMSSTLHYEVLPEYPVPAYLLNTAVVFAVALILILLHSRFPKITRTLLTAGILAAAGIGMLNISGICKTYSWYLSNNAASEEMPEIPLSKDGKNVVVLMLDRAMGTQVPYIFNEKPELKEQFDGFTYYKNTISFGQCTNIASPAIWGGYEYTPERINARDSESLESKHNESLKVMPVIFGDKGYEVTIFDPPFAGYSYVPDLSIYDDHPEFNCSNLSGRFNYFENSDDSDLAPLIALRTDEIRNRNFFCYSLMKVSPLLIQGTLYNGGKYNEALYTGTDKNSTHKVSLEQQMSGLSTGTGFSNVFLDSYAVLDNLPELTAVSDSDKNTFLLMANDTTHSPCLLQEPDYVPALIIDNTEYDQDMISKYTVDGVTMKMTEESQITQYHVDMAAFLKLGEWFDYLRENDVYDNTRIIIVSDHGKNLGQFGYDLNGADLENFMPTLMVKDFDAHGYTVSDEFMTNGDTPVLATSGLIENPVNPFTKNPINSDLKNGPQTVFYTNRWQVDENNGNKFFPGVWYTVEGDPHDPDNWERLGVY